MRELKMKKGKSLNFFKTFIKVLVELVRGAKYEFIKHLGFVVCVVQVLFPVMVCVLVQETEINYLAVILISCFFYFVVKCLKEVSYILNSTSRTGFPIPEHYLTEVDRNGFIGFKQGAEEEAILYLNDVEEYLKKKGYL